VLPVYVHQFSSKRLIDYQHRIRMCQISLETLANPVTRVRVLPLEQEVSESCGVRHGTIDTVNYILRKDPNANLHLVIGEDAYRDICQNKWKHGERLFELCHVHVIERLGLPPSSNNTPPLSPSFVPSVYRCYQRHHIPSLNNVSSTEIRAVSAYPYWPLPIENPFLVEELDPAVYSYLKSHGLYNFSEEALGRQRRCRLYFLGIISWAMALWSMTEREGI
jgi:nicotinic acid mononucleotide adenylyltransferase